MAKNYRQLAESIRGRINPDNFVFKREFSDELSTISYSDILTYIRFCMKGVEPEYTQKSLWQHRETAACQRQIRW